MYTLRLKHQFSAAHQLRNAYDEKCNASLHGHNWEVLVEIKTRTLVNNMVIDFKLLKDVINELDHKNLNEVLKFEPTAENIAEYLAKEIEKVRKNIKIKITIWETKGASIQYE